MIKSKVLFKNLKRYIFVQVKSRYENWSVIGVGYIWRTLTDSDSSTNYYKSGLSIIFLKYEFQLCFIEMENKETS